MLMNRISAWFASKNLTTHWLAAMALALAGVITTDPQVRDLLTKLFQSHPSIAADIILAAGIIAKYSRSSSAAGTVANAKAIMSNGNAPTAAQIDAATTK